MPVKASYNVRLGVLFAFIAGLQCSSAFAQAVTSGCFVAPARMSDSDIAAFLTKPDSLVANFPIAGLAMATQVRGLAGSSTSTLDPIFNVIPQSSKDQKAAIGAGLARAARSCQAATPDYAQLIQQKVASLNDSDVTAAFTAALDDVQTASLGGAAGAGSAASGLSGGGVVAGGGSTTGGDTPTATTTQTFSVATRATFSRFSVQRISVSP
jgi:hypothetical protein